MDNHTWLFLALISPIFWAIVHVLDSYCVDNVFDRPWMGIITSALTMLLALPFLAIGLVFTELGAVSLSSFGLCLLCGTLFMISQLMYFKALSISESGIVAAYWNFVPLLLPVASFFVLGEVLTVAHYLGAAVLIATSVIFCLLDGNLEARGKSFALMFIAAICQIGYFLLQKEAFAACPVYEAFLLITLAMILAGLAPLLKPVCRRRFRGNWPRIKPVWPFLLLIEVANLIAIGTSLYAVSFGSPSLVAAVEASIPAYTFLLSLFLFAVTRHLGEEEARHWLPLKLCLVGFMVFGVWLVS